MSVYTVHAPSPAGADLRATDKFVFVRDGFHFWAMIFGPLWLLWNRLWLALIGWMIFLAAFDAGLHSLGVGDDEDSAERRFFERWSQKQRGIVNDQWAGDRGSPPPTRSVPGQPFS